MSDTFIRLRDKFEQFLATAEQRVESHPWLVVILMHEYYRHLYPADPFMPLDTSRSPSERIDDVLDGCLRTLDSASWLGSYFLSGEAVMSKLVSRLEGRFSDRSGEGETQRVYGRLWDQFDPGRAPEEARRLLDNRLSGGGMDMGWLRGKDALDSGCGCGRYTIAMAAAGAKRAVGSDLGAASIELAKRMADAAGVSNVEFVLGDSLSLPFEDESFDFALSNGVLHHTQELQSGLRELHRVLRPGGRAFFYVSGTGGLFWHSRRRMPTVMSRIPQAYSMALLELIGMPGNRFIFNDNWHVPIEEHRTRAAVERDLQAAGFVEVKKIFGSHSTDLDVAVAGGDEEAKAIWGEGEHRYLIQRG